MKISIFGTGYVGLVTGVCLSNAGHKVICVDINKNTIDTLNSGKVPIYEPGLERILKKNIKNKNISFTSDSSKAVDHAKLIFIAVGTPPAEDGSADLKHVLKVAKTIGNSISAYKVIINKSTVPVGTQEKVKKEILNSIKNKGSSVKFSVCSNPEFLKEGAAINDFTNPDRIICGIEDGDLKAKKLLLECYEKFNKSKNKILFMNPRSAELTKYAANSILATKISFMNELSNLADLLNIDINDVKQGIGTDTRIGDKFINPGCGYGGSCFPKDVQALINISEKNNFDPKILKSVESVNKYQKNLIFKKVKYHFKSNLRSKVIALWGISFKPETDDIREAPSINFINSALKAGAEIKAYDPIASKSMEGMFESKKFHICKSAEEALVDSDCLTIFTEWEIFKLFDLSKIKKLLKKPLVFDGRNIFEPRNASSIGIKYIGIGRNNLE